jgi:carboxyl-terminal processing protease
MSARSRLFIALVSTAFIAYIAIGSLLGRVLGDTSYGQLAVFNEVVRLVLEGYVEPVNLDRAMAGARLGLTDALDGDSAYLDADEWKLLQQPTKDDADIGVVITRRFGFLMVVAPRTGSPAEKAGLRTGDILKTIDGRHTRPLAAASGQRLLRGAPGSSVKLTILRAGVDPFEVSVVRERLSAAAPTSRILEDGAGYLKITELSAKSADEARAAVESLKRGGAKGLVLDLRGAAQGAPAEGVKIAELFMNGGVVAKLSGAKTAEQILSAAQKGAVWEGPMAVLIDTGTSGAGEIVAAALRDANRGPLVGERTFGRVGVQKQLALADGGMILTVARYVSPKGTAIHGQGVQPTVAVGSGPDDGSDETPAPAPIPGKDPILDKALELLRSGEAKKAA